MAKLKLLAIFAHPDDESMGSGGTLAKYSAERVETYLICATRGERGWFGPEEQNPGLERLGQLRTEELLCAGERLGLNEINILNYIDGDLDKADHAEVIGKIVAYIRRVRPQIVITFPPDGNYGHPDHIAISQFASAAIVCAADASFIDPEDRSPHRISKFYYMVDSDTFVNLIAPAMGDMAFQVDDQTRGEVAWKDWAVTTRVDVSAFAKVAWEAIKCHQSQLATLGPLVNQPEENIHYALSLQGTFYRVFSLVNGGRKVEADLFDGLR